MTRKATRGEWRAIDQNEMGCVTDWVEVFDEPKPGEDFLAWLGRQTMPTDVEVARAVNHIMSKVTEDEA